MSRLVSRNFVASTSTSFIFPLSIDNLTSIMSAPVSTHTVETAVIHADIGKVWEVISSLDFSFWSVVASSELKSGASKQTLDAVIQINFKDGASWQIQVVELSSLHEKITFQIVDSSPAQSYSSALHTISLKKLSTGSQSFIEWTTNFSNDATIEIVVDSTFKRREAFNDLNAFLAHAK